MSPTTVKKIWYYLDEALVFSVMVVAVLFKESVAQLGKGDIVTHVVLNLPRIIGAVLVSIMLYGTLHDSFKYNENKKPPLYKRLMVAVFFGLGIQGGAEAGMSFLH